MAMRLDRAFWAVVALTVAGCDRVGAVMADLSDLIPSALMPGGEASPAQAPERASALQDPEAAPSLSSARWIGLTPAVAAAPAAGEGAWIAGPFPETGGTVWVSDTVTGLTVRARLDWREPAPDGLVLLSTEAARGLGLATGAIANVAIYAAR